MRARSILLIILSVLFVASCATVETDDMTIGIAWRPDEKSNSYKRVYDYLSSLGNDVVMLGLATSSDLEYYGTSLSDDYLNYDFSLSSDAAEILKETDDIKIDEIDSVDLIVFTGGEDVSPSLYGEDFLLDDPVYNPDRDSSDYLTMRYALENDIPIFCICRGMQMLGALEGGKLIMDLPEYLDEDIYAHRTIEGSYTFHSLETDDNLLSSLSSVASSHHQSIDIDNPGLLTITSTYKGVVESVTLDGGAFVYGVQFHPEYFVYTDGKERDESLALLRDILRLSCIE